MILLFLLDSLDRETFGLLLSLSFFLLDLPLAFDILTFELLFST